jgi:diguanylate cyclase (GGDEF)-like protein
MRSDGAELWVRVRVSDIDVDDRPLSLMSLEDVTASKAREDQLRHDSLHDALTGLPNRRLLLDRLGRALSRSRRTGSRLAVFFIDLDDLKRINDTHPWQHRAGDLLITTVAVAIRDTLRDTDTLARYGGDEFVAICEDVGDDATLAELGERVLDAVREPFVIGNETVHAGVSIGLAVPESDSESGEDLLARADGAMYRAKATGGGRVVRADRMLAARDDDDLAAALARDELRQLYRPVVSLSTGALLGVRAVLRWRHPHLGTMSSQDVRAALDSGASAMPVVNWTLQRAIDDVRTVAPDRVEHLSVWLTMPGRAATAPSTQAALVTALAGPDGSLSPDSAPSLVLEVNEHELASMSRRPALRRHLEELVAVGPIALGVEDLTADTLPLGTLQLVSAASVSLDPELLAAADENQSTEDLVRSLVSAAAALGVITIATRVESQTDLDRARHLGVHAVQGDLIGPAAMLDAYADLLQGGRLSLGTGPRVVVEDPAAGTAVHAALDPALDPATPTRDPARRRSLWLVVDEPDPVEPEPVPPSVVESSAVEASAVEWSAPPSLPDPAVATSAPQPHAVPVPAPFAPQQDAAPAAAAAGTTPVIQPPYAGPQPHPAEAATYAQPQYADPAASAAPPVHIDLTERRAPALSPWNSPGVDLADELAAELGVEIPVDLATLLARELGVELPAEPR